MIHKIISSIQLIFIISIISSTIGYGQEVNYSVSSPEPHTHYFNIEMKVEGIRKPYIDVKMPVWAPGSYLVREFAKGIETLHAYEGDKKLKAEKLNKNTWRIHSNKSTNISIQYNVYAFELSVRTSFVDASHAYINGTSVFMYVDGFQNVKGQVQFKEENGWKKVSTSLAKVDGNNWVRSYPNYDILVDSPIEIGNHVEFSFDAAGVKHNVAMYGEGNYDIERLKTDMAKIVEAATNVFGENPNKEYTFIIHNLTKGGGGLEHLSSTSLQVDRWTYEGSKYLGFLSLVAHEYFHLWNVKRIRPIELGPFNYDEENYTDLLWVMEGFTSYYDELLLLRAGFYDMDRYLNKLSGTISSIENQPGNKIQPVAHASFDAWIKAYRSNENSYNNTISYYPKGAALASLIDLEIIKSTNGEKNLDDFMQVLYNDFYKKLGRGFSEEEFKASLEKMVGHDMNDFFNNYVYDTQTIDYNHFFGYAGLELKNSYDKTEASLGASLSSEGGNVIVKMVARYGSAWSGGLNVNDEIIALDGFRVDKKSLENRLKLYKPGDKVTLTIARDEIIQTIDFPLKKKEYIDYKFAVKDDFKEEAKTKVATKWLMK